MSSTKPNTPAMAVPASTASATQTPPSEHEPVWSLSSADWLPEIAVDHWPTLPTLPALHWPALSWPSFNGWPNFTPHWPHWPWESTASNAVPSTNSGSCTCENAKAKPKEAAAPTATAANGATKLTHPALRTPVMRSIQPPVINLDLVEEMHQYVVSAEVAGVRASDIDVRVERDSRIVKIALIRRRNVNCDCNFVDDCNTQCANACTATCTKARSGGNAAVYAVPASGQMRACDGKCKVRNGAHCSDCEKKGEINTTTTTTTTTPTETSATNELVSGCCGLCAGALMRTGGHVYRRSERSFGRAQRAFRAPADVDLHGIECTLRNGVLTVTMPRVPRASVSATIKGSATQLPSQLHDSPQILRFSVYTPVETLSEADRKAMSEAKAQWKRAAEETAKAATANTRLHHVSAPDTNPTVTHERVMHNAVAGAADPSLRSALLHHHMLRSDPLSAWAYGSPVAAYSSVLRDAMELARDFGLVAHHIHPPVYNPTVEHDRVMHQAIAAAKAKAPTGAAGASTHNSSDADVKSASAAGAASQSQSKFRSEWERARHSAHNVQIQTPVVVKPLTPPSAPATPGGAGM